MADGLEIDYGSIRAGADAIERIPGDNGVTSIWLDYNGDFGHEALQSEAGSFLARWQGGGREMQRAHEGIALDMRQSASAMEFLDNTVGKGFGRFTDLLDGDG